MAPLKTPPAGVPIIDPGNPNSLVYSKLLEVSECVSGMRSEMGAFVDATQAQLKSCEGRVGAVEQRQDVLENRQTVLKTTVFAWGTAIVILGGGALAVFEFILKN